MNWDWEDIWLGLLFSAVIGLLTFVGFAICSKHTVGKYYIESGRNIDEICIRVDIDWQQDPIINLDRSITYDQAVELVNKLNKK